MAIRIDPNALTAAADRLAGARAGLAESLGTKDADMWAVPQAYQDYFGPASKAAATYAELARRVPGYVQSAASRLDQGADAFRSAADWFARTDNDNAAWLRKRPR